MTILGRGIDGLPLATDSLVVGMDSVLDELPVGTLGNVLTVTGTGVDWANPIGFGGDLQAINNLNDVSNTQTAIDNLTIANTVTVNVLQLTDHGSNSLVWSIEEDSASPTNALTFDYNSIEQVRIDPTGVITAGGLILDGPILSLGGSDLELTPASGQDLLFNGLVWPDTDGVTGQVLITDGSGTLSFGTTGSGGPAFLDNVFRIQDEGDNSKEIAFEAFNLTTSTIRTITMPDQNIDLTPGTGSFATEAEGNLAATALQNVSEDISPQLGGPLDMNSFSIGDGSRELISFVEDPAAANQIEIENEAPGSGPILRSAGDDTNIDLNLSSKGTGIVNITGDVIVSGTVDGRDIAADGALLDTALQNVVEDTSPTLGGTLNVGAFDFANSNGIVIGLATGGEDSVNHVEIDDVECYDLEDGDCQV